MLSWTKDIYTRQAIIISSPSPNSRNCFSWACSFSGSSVAELFRALSAVLQPHEHTNTTDSPMAEQCYLHISSSLVVIHVLCYYKDGYRTCTWLLTYPAGLLPPWGSLRSKSATLLPVDHSLISVGTMITTCIILSEEHCNHLWVPHFCGFQHMLHHQNNRSGCTTG